MSGRTLLVGGTGFLGSFVAARLAEQKPLVLARSTSDTSVLPDILEVVRGDLDRPLPLAGVDTLVFCASMGFGHVPSLIDQLQAHGVRRAVFVSTTAIFTSLPAPSRAVRLAAEHAVQHSGLDWTIVRPTMIYGTARDRNVSRLLGWLRRCPAFPLVANAWWQPVHVEDLADVIVSALSTPTSISQAYNVAGAEPLRFADLVRSAARAVRRRAVLLPVPMRAALLGARATRLVTPEQILRLAEDKAFDISPAVRDLGFRPRSFVAGVTAEAQLLRLAT